MSTRGYTYAFIHYRSGLEVDGAPKMKNTIFSLVRNNIKFMFDDWLEACSSDLPNTVRKLVCVAAFVVAFLGQLSTCDREVRCGDHVQCTPDRRFHKKKYNNLKQTFRVIINLSSFAAHTRLANPNKIIRNKKFELNASWSLHFPANYGLIRILVCLIYNNLVIGRTHKFEIKRGKKLKLPINTP